MIHFLVSAQTLIYRSFNCARLPVKAPPTIVVFEIMRILQFNVPKTIVLQCIPNNFYIVSMQQKVVPPIGWWVWSYGNRIIIRSKYQEVLPHLWQLKFQFLISTRRFRLYSRSIHKILRSNSLFSIFNIIFCWVLT